MEQIKISLEIIILFILIFIVGFLVYLLFNQVNHYNSIDKAINKNNVFWQSVVTENQKEIKILEKEIENFKKNVPNTQKN